MKAAAVMLALLAPPALAEQTIVWFEPVDGQPHFGALRHHNRLTSGTPDVQVFTVETDRGAVEISLTTTPNNACNDMACPDTLDILSTPPGVLAQPVSLAVPEQTVGEILLYEWSGT